MKNARSSYKAVVYEDTSLGRWGSGQARPWIGQITSRVIELSEYWIFHFLNIPRISEKLLRPEHAA